MDIYKMINTMLIRKGCRINRVEGVLYVRTPDNETWHLTVPIETDIERRTFEPGPNYLRSKDRPANYGELQPAEQWVEDKELGILDWDGSVDT